jgi:SAM-dependent methyltransferase
VARESWNLLVNRIHDGELSRFVHQYVRGRVIDIGCGAKPYAKLLAPYVTEHVGLDHELTPHDRSSIDLIGTAYEIPAETDYFDSAICTAVLEHLEEPELALRECHRVIRPGGYVIYSVPFIWHLHEEPRDFFRYSKYGLQYLFEKSGFHIVEMRALSGFWVTFLQLFVYYLSRFHRGPLRWFPIIPMVGYAIQGIAYVLDRMDKAEQWTWMYMVVARKPGGDPPALLP